MQTDEGSDEGASYLLFEIGQKPYAVQLAAVAEVLWMVAYTEVPSWPAPLVGVIDIRGTLLAIADIAPLLGDRAVTRDPTAFIIVVSHAQARFGLLASRVVDLLAAEATSVAAVLPEQVTIPRAVCSAFLHLGESRTPVLDVSMLLTPDEWRLAEQAAQPGPSSPASD